MNSPSAAEFEQHRSLLLGVAYRMLSSHADAEDIVQDCYLRWERADREEIRSPRSWLTTVCSRLCLDRLKSARARREQYVGDWLPEPLVERDLSPSRAAQIDESVSTALLLILEQLSPSERAAFLLHDVFQFTFEEVAEILGKTGSSCRKLAQRARDRVAAGKPRFAPDPATHHDLVHAFWQAADEGDTNRLQQLLSGEAFLRSDGGGIVPAVSRTLEGAETIARFFVGIARAAKKSGAQISSKTCWINGSPGLLLYQDDQLATALSFTVGDDGKIHSLFAQRNPEKLRLIASQE